MKNSFEIHALTKNEKMIVGKIMRLYQGYPRLESERGADEIWLQTREIAEHCDINVYQARYYLLNLETKGLVIHKTSPGRDRLYWCMRA